MRSVLDNHIATAGEKPWAGGYKPCAQRFGAAIGYPTRKDMLKVQNDKSVPKSRFPCFEQKISDAYNKALLMLKTKKTKAKKWAALKSYCHAILDATYYPPFKVDLHIDGATAFEPDAIYDVAH